MSEGIKGEVALSDAEIDARVVAYGAGGDFEIRRNRLWTKGRSVIEPELRAYYADLFRVQYGADETATQAMLTGIEEVYGHRLDADWVRSAARHGRCGRSSSSRRTSWRR